VVKGFSIGKPLIVPTVKASLPASPSKKFDLKLNLNFNYHEVDPLE
jgi:hypothetical protein